MHFTIDKENICAFSVVKKNSLSLAKIGNQNTFDFITISAALKVLQLVLLENDQ